MSSASDNGSVANGNLAAETKKLSLTDREQEILSKAWGCMKSQPEIDYNKLAAETGMTNPRSASNAWSALKKKLFTNVPATPRTKKGAATAGVLPPATEDGETSGTAASSKRKRAPASKKKTAAAAAADADDDVEEVEATPTKKKRAAPRKKATPAKVEPKAEDDEDKSAVKAETEAAKKEEDDEQKPKPEEPEEI